jgi:Putative zinc-finger
MTCHDARELLSALLDEALDAEERRHVEAHLETCAECRLELEGLRQTVTLLHRVQPAHAPVGFVDRVVAARESPWYRRVAAAIFVPLSVKLPVEATALLMVGLLAAYIFERTPALQQAARDDGTPMVSAPAPQEPAASRRGPTELLADKPGRSEPRRYTREPLQEFAQGERNRRDPAAPSEQVAPAAPPPPAASAPGPRSEDRLAPYVQPEVKTESTREGAVSSTARSESETREKDASSAKAAASAARLAAKRVLPSADVVARVAVRDRDEAERDLSELITRTGGTETQRRRDDDATLVEALIPQARYAEFSRGLAQIGTWQIEAERPDLPAQIRILLRLSQ